MQSGNMYLSALASRFVLCVPAISKGALVDRFQGSELSRMHLLGYSRHPKQPNVLTASVPGNFVGCADKESILLWVWSAYTCA